MQKTFGFELKKFFFIVGNMSGHSWYKRKRQASNLGLPTLCHFHMGTPSGLLPSKGALQAGKTWGAKKRKNLCSRRKNSTLICVRQLQAT